MSSLTDTWAKQDKAARKSATRVLPGWQRDVIPKGSPEESRHVEAMLDKITDKQMDFMSYPSDMNEWEHPSELQTKLDKSNETYCRYMLDMCADPLSHGVNRDSVIEAVGMYVGMSLFSDDFKKTVRKDVANTLFPVVEKIVRADAKVSDFLAAGQQRMSAGIESVTGKEIPGSAKIFDRIPKQESAEVYLSGLRDSVMAENNHGRIPFTPESAAVMHLNFGVQAYTAMREPGADVKAIQKKFTEANKTLKSMAALDGIDETQLDRNIRAVYGKVTMKYPDMARMFEETAYGGIDAAEGDMEVGPDKILRSVWRGQFKTKAGEPYTGDLTPRAPRTKSEYSEMSQDLFKSAYDACENLGDIQSLWSKHDVKFADSVAFMEQMINEDAVFDPDDTRTARDVMLEAHMAAGKAWGEAHPTTQEERNRARQHRGRDTSGLGNFGEAEDSGPEYC